MKFRFCGDADCPDWLLMQINTLSSLDSDSLKKLCEHIVLSFFNEDDLNYAELEKITRGTFFDVNDVKACLSAVRQIVQSSACHGVTEEELTAELQQLGLEMSQSTVIGDVFQEHRDRLTTKLRNESIRIARMKNVSIEETGSNGEYLVKMSVLDGSSDKLEEKKFLASKEQLLNILNASKKLKSRMSELQNQDNNSNE